MLFQGVDVRTSEIMEQEARRLAGVLGPRLAWWDNYVPPTGLDLVLSKWGPVSYAGILKATEVLALGGAGVLAGASLTVPKPSELRLMGVLGGARMQDPDALHQFPQILRRTAVLLGAEMGSITEFRNSMRLQRNEKTGEVELVDPTKVAVTEQTTILLPGADAGASRVVMPGAPPMEAQSITLSWPFKE